MYIHVIIFTHASILELVNGYGLQTHSFIGVVHSPIISVWMGLSLSKTFRAKLSSCRSKVLPVIMVVVCVCVCVCVFVWAYKFVQVVLLLYMYYTSGTIVLSSGSVLLSMPLAI